MSTCAQPYESSRLPHDLGLPGRATDPASKQAMEPSAPDKLSCEQSDRDASATARAIHMFEHQVNHSPLHAAVLAASLGCASGHNALLLKQQRAAIAARSAIRHVKLQPPAAMRRWPFDIARVI